MLAFIHRIVGSMSFDSIVGIAGLLISIYSLIQAKSATQMAEEAKKEVQKNRQASDLSRLSGFLEVAIQEIKVYGPATPDQRLRGLDKHKVAERVQEFILELRACFDRFNRTEKIKATQLCNEITALLNEFTGQGKSLAETKKAGQDILYKLSSFNSDLKANLNKQIERG